MPKKASPKYKRLRRSRVAKTVEVGKFSEVLVDLSKDGHVVGIEILA
jgi:uncharacterized protein YuzE